MAGNIARIDALMAKKNSGKITPDELAELNNLLAAQGQKAAAAPYKAPDASPTAGAGVVPNASTPATMPKDWKPGPPEDRFAAEEARIAKGEAARKAALAAGKSKAEADAAALEAYTGYTGDKPASGIDIAAAMPAATSEAPLGAPFTGIENPDLYKNAPLTGASAEGGGKPAEKSAVQRLIEGLQAEEKKTGPNVWDFIEAGAAGWQGKKAAYLEKAAAEAERKQKLEELARTAELETELQAGQNAAAKERALIAAGVGIPSTALAGVGGVGGVGGLSKGSALAAQLAAYLGGK